MKHIAIAFLLLTTGLQTTQAQSKVKGAYRQYTKGDVEKAYETLMEIDLIEAETEYYYVRFLCDIDSAKNGEELWQLKKWLIEANPILVEDEKDRERLLKSFDLDEARHLELYEQLFARAFTYYVNLNTLAGWKEHNSRFPNSSKFASSWIYESIAALEEAKDAGGTPALFESVYRNYSGTDAAEEAYELWVDRSFEAAKAEGSSRALLDFESSFPQEPEAKEARVLARKIDFESARELNRIEALEGFLNKYADGAEREQAKSILAVLYRAELKPQQLDFDFYKRYRDNYAEYDEEEIVLLVDSLFNASLYQLLLSPAETDHTQAINWHKNVERSANSFGYAILDRNIENQEERFIPYLDGILEHRIGLISRATVAGSVKDYRFESIIRDGNSYYSVYMDDYWWPIYVDRDGDVRFLTESGFKELSRITQGGCLLGYAADNQIIDIFGEIVVTRETNISSARASESGWVKVDWYMNAASAFEGPVDCVNFWNHQVNVVTDGGWSASTQTADGTLYIFGESAQGVRTAYNHQGMPIWEHKDLSFETDGLVLNLLGGNERYYVLGDSVILNPHDMLVFDVDSLGRMVLYEHIERVYQDPWDVEVEGWDWQTRGLWEHYYYEEEWPFFGRFVLQDLEGGAQDFNGWGRVEGTELVFKLALNDYLRIDRRTLNTMKTEKKSRVLSDAELMEFLYDNREDPEALYNLYHFEYCEEDHYLYCDNSLYRLNIDILDGEGYETGFLRPSGANHWELGLTQVDWVGYAMGSLGYFKHRVSSREYGNFRGDSTWKFLEGFMDFRCEAIASYSDCEGFEKSYQYFKSQLDDLNFPTDFEDYANDLKLMFIVETSADLRLYQIIDALNEDDAYTAEEWVEALYTIAYGYEGFEGDAYHHTEATEIMNYIVEEIVNEGYLENDLDSWLYEFAAELNAEEGYDRNAVNLWAKYIESGREQENLGTYAEVSTLYKMGFLYFELDDFRSAIGVWKQALDIAEEENMEWFWSDGNIFINLGAAHANLNDYETMCRYYKIALGSGSQEAISRWNRGCE